MQFLIIIATSFKVLLQFLDPLFKCIALLLRNRLFVHYLQIIILFLLPTRILLHLLHPLPGIPELLLALLLKFLHLAPETQINFPGSINYLVLVVNVVDQDFDLDIFI